MPTPIVVLFVFAAALAVACGGSSPQPTEPADMSRDEPQPGPPPSEPVPSDMPASGAAVPESSAAQVPHWTPTTITSFQIFHFEEQNELAEQLQAVDVVTLELEEIEAAGGKTVTDRAHAQGTRVVCYTSSGYEDWRTDASRYPEDAKGSNICKDDACTSTWPGETWGDIRRPSLLEFLGQRADRAAVVGCDGIEFDNMDPAFNRTGLDVTPEENVVAARALARLAHERGLGAMAKNAGELASALATSFDGVYVEECEQYGECEVYSAYRGKLVAMVEYAAVCRRRDWAACSERDDYFDSNGR
jgi:hypothetical protein